MKRYSQIFSHTFVIKKAEGATRLTGVALHAWLFESSFEAESGELVYSHTVLCHAWLLYKVTN